MLWITKEISAFVSYEKIYAQSLEPTLANLSLAGRLVALGGMASLPSPNNLQDPSSPQNPKSPQSPTLNPLKQTFAATLNCDSPLHFAMDDLPSPFVDYRNVSLRISEEPYLRGLNKCKTMLIGCISPSSKAAPLKSHEFVKQLRPLWSSLQPWTITP